MCANCHIANINIELSDLDAIKKACEAMGWEFKENQKTWKWFAFGWQDDSPIPEGLFTPERKAEIEAMDRSSRIFAMNKALGKCDHAIKVPFTKYEIGLIKQPNGSYGIIWETYCNNQTTELIPKFKNEYSLCQAEQMARRMGLPSCREGGMVKIQMPEGGEVVVAAGDKVTVEAQNYKGEACTDATKPFIEALGSIASTSPKEEMYEEEKPMEIKYG